MAGDRPTAQEEPEGRFVLFREVEPKVIDMEFPVFSISVPTPPERQKQLLSRRIDDLPHIVIFLTRDDAEQYMESRDISLSIVDIDSASSLADMAATQDQLVEHIVLHGESAEPQVHAISDLPA